jgi:dTDP-4-amino-4,6-dideoxygalactose transaminase
VTQPSLPPLEEFVGSLEKIWQSKWLTNNGPFHQEFESAVTQYLGVSHLSLISNGTIALITALQTLRITGEVITTPYSFVATAHSLLWNNIRPVFVDIDMETMNLDPEKIQAAITPQTSAILAVHCYGNPCNVQRIQQIADIYGLKVIYDAAHAFGVRYNGESVLLHGDLSILSMHATKVFNTIEGGAIICGDTKTKKRIDYLKNFGFADEVTVVAPGINGKMNELQAAFGMLQLKYVDFEIAKRRIVDQYYRDCLGDVPGIAILSEPSNATRNYGYFPVLVKPEYSLTRDGLYQSLRQAEIHARRYFYPLISDMPMYRGLNSANPANLSVAKEVAEQVICLPIYPGLARADQDRVIEVVRRGRC